MQINLDAAGPHAVTADSSLTLKASMAKLQGVTVLVILCSILGE